MCSSDLSTILQVQKAAKHPHCIRNTAFINAQHRRNRGGICGNRYGNGFDIFSCCNRQLERSSAALFITPSSEISPCLSLRPRRALWPKGEKTTGSVACQGSPAAKAAEALALRLRCFFRYRFVVLPAAPLWLVVPIVKALFPLASAALVAQDNDGADHHHQDQHTQKHRDNGEALLFVLVLVVFVLIIVVIGGGAGRPAGPRVRGSAAHIGGLGGFRGRLVEGGGATLLLGLGVVLLGLGAVLLAGGGVVVVPPEEPVLTSWVSLMT